jgi:hypothetical protein
MPGCFRTFTFILSLVFSGCNFEDVASSQFRERTESIHSERSPSSGNEPPIAKSSYFVAVQGDDRNDGSAAKPFATLRHAATAMERSAIKTTYVEDGIYMLSSALILGAADDGETILARPQHATILSGGVRGLSSLVAIRGAKNLTITGLTFENGGTGGALFFSGANFNTITGNHFVNNAKSIILAAGSSHNLVSGNEIDASTQTAIEVKDGSNANTFDSNLINQTGAVGTAGGGFFLHGVRDNQISHNLVENTAGLGIGISNWNSATINVGNLVEFNIVRNTNTAAGSTDSGGIYILGRSQIDTKTIIRDNLVIGTGAPHPAHTVGVYLDDLTSGAVVQDNILTGIGSDAVQIHGGQRNIVTNNILDTGSGRASAILFQAAPSDTHPKIAMTDNVVSRNIIYSTSSTPRVFVYYGGGAPAISDNLYFNTTGASMATQPPVQDLRPQFGNPSFANPAKGDYTIGAESFASAVSFHPIEQGRIGLMPTTCHWY